MSDFEKKKKNRLRGWLDLQPVALLEGAGVGEGGGGGGPGRERVGSWNLGDGLRSGATAARGHPAAGGSDRGNCLRTAGCVAFLMRRYWNPGENWNECCNEF